MRSSKFYSKTIKMMPDTKAIVLILIPMTIIFIAMTTLCIVETFGNPDDEMKLITTKMWAVLQAVFYFFLACYHEGWLGKMYAALFGTNLVIAAFLWSDEEGTGNEKGPDDESAITEKMSNHDHTVVRDAPEHPVVVVAAASPPSSETVDTMPVASKKKIKKIKKASS